MIGPKCLPLKEACVKLSRLSGWSSAISRQEHLQESEETNNMDLVKVIESENIRNQYSEVEVGDFVKAHLLIKGNKTMQFRVTAQSDYSEGNLLLRQES